MADYSEHDTDQLLVLAAAGDAVATTLVFDRYRGRLKSMVSRRMDPRLIQRIDPSDVVQECLTTAHVKLREYLKERSIEFYPWLRSIAWDRLVDLHRRHVLAQCRSVNREVPLEVGLSDDSVSWLASQLLAPGIGPLQQLAECEIHQRVRQALERLSPMLAEALLLRYLEQLSASEAAQVLSVSQAAFKQRLVRALRQLRSLLLAEGEVEP